MNTSNIIGKIIEMDLKIYRLMLIKVNSASVMQVLSQNFLVYSLATGICKLRIWGGPMKEVHTQLLKRSERGGKACDIFLKYLI